GIEEELMILDAETLALSPGVEALVGWAESRSLPGVLKMELLASMVELATEVCASPVEGLTSLRELRAGAAEAATGAGLALAAAGTHPFSIPTAQQVAPDPRYREFVEYAGVSARRQAVCGLHVHVGMPSAEACMTALEGVLPWLPVVLALSANSPFLAGEETGLMSSRAEVLALVEPAAHELGSVELLGRIDPAACEGDRQLEVGRAESVEAVVADVAERTLGSG